jgi:Leucine-rich repeat (LRR) protein
MFSQPGGLWAYCTKLSSLAGLEKLTQLEPLDVSYSSIPSLKPLAPLPNLKTVNLRGPKIKSLEGLPYSVTNLLLGD